MWIKTHYANCQYVEVVPGPRHLRNTSDSLSRLIPLVSLGGNTVICNVLFSSVWADWVLAEYFIRSGGPGRWLMPGLELLGLMSVPNHCQSNFLPIFNFLRTLINKTCIHTQNTGSNIFIIFLFSQVTIPGWNFFSGNKFLVTWSNSRNHQYWSHITWSRTQ